MAEIGNTQMLGRDREHPDVLTILRKLDTHTAEGRVSLSSIRSSPKDSEYYTSTIPLLCQYYASIAPALIKQDPTFN